MESSFRVKLREIINNNISTNNNEVLLNIICYLLDEHSDMAFEEAYKFLDDINFKTHQIKILT